MLDIEWDDHAAKVLEGLPSRERDMAHEAMSEAASDWDRALVDSPVTTRLPPNEHVDMTAVRTASGAWLLVSRSESVLRVHDLVPRDEVEVLLDIAGSRGREP